MIGLEKISLSTILLGVVIYLAVWFIRVIRAR